MLRIEHYSKTYPGGKKAVDDLTLHVRPGEIYGFIGHNGAGKTTTLRAVAGVMDFTEGTITIDGRDYLLCIMTGAPYSDRSAGNVSNLAASLIASYDQVA